MRVLMSRKPHRRRCFVPAGLVLVAACSGGGGADGNSPGTIQLLQTSFDAPE
jgi:hypothetical protein